MAFVLQSLLSYSSNSATPRKQWWFVRGSKTGRVNQSTKINFWNSSVRTTCRSIVRGQKTGVKVGPYDDSPGFRLTGTPGDRRTTPSPRRRVSFNVPRGVPMEDYNPPRTSPIWPTFRPTSAQFTPRRQNYGGNPQRNGGWRGSNPQAMSRQPAGELSPCPKCGRRPHPQPNYCPAFNKTYNYCIKVGHFSAVCRAAARDHYEGRPNINGSMRDKRRCTPVVR